MTKSPFYTKIRIMSGESDWSVAFYAESNGRTSVREFLAGLDLQTQARLRSAIELLLHRNVQAREPLVRHLEGKL